MLLFQLNKIYFCELQEAATSTQSVSSDSSSNDEKMMITITTEADQSDIAMSDTIDSRIKNELS